MSQLSIKLPQKLQAQARERAAESGHKSVDQYVKNLIIADVAQNQELDPELEKVLLDRLQTGGEFEVTPEFWLKLDRRIHRKLANKSKAKKK